MKFANTDIVFQEIPDEVTLAINISGCPCHCPGCHSQYLWEDVGEELTTDRLDGFVQLYGQDITCISFMGGDADPAEVNRLAEYLHTHHPHYRTAWYTGRVRISSKVDMANFNYIKVGPYIAHLGPLKERTTNQRLYRINAETREKEDITSRFWKK